MFIRRLKHNKRTHIFRLWVNPLASTRV